MKIKVLSGTIGFFVCLFFGALLVSCDQEPLFWDIAYEPAPIEPRIQGAPTKIVSITTTASPWEGKLYVSNRDYIWEYEHSAAVLRPQWSKINNSSEFQTADLAAVGSTLYALDRNGKVWGYDGSAWSSVDVSAVRGKIDCIFGCGSYLFVGSLSGSPGSVTGYDIYVFSGNTISSEKQGTGMLMGAAELGAGNYYLGTLGDGLYLSVNGAAPAPVTDYEREEIIGLTVFNNKLYTVHPRKIRCLGESSSIATGNFTSAITGWTDGTDYLLLVGLRRSNGTFGYGYREINLLSGSFPSSLRIPGADDPTSVENRSHYTSAIGKNVVNNLWVLENSDSGDDKNRPIIFASTSKEGLWSYRVRDGNAQWNGEY